MASENRDTAGHGYRGLLVDWGGVMTTDLFASFRAFCEEAGLEPDTIRRRFREDRESRNLLIALETGKLSEEEFEPQFAAKLGIDGAGLIDRLFAGSSVDERMVAAVAAARAAGVRTGLISNSGAPGATTARCCRACSTASSSPARWVFASPRPRSTRWAPTASDSLRRDCVFVDDLPFNLEPAAELGMATVHHVSPDQTIPQLEELLEVKLGVRATELAQGPREPQGSPSCTNACIVTVCACAADPTVTLVTPAGIVLLSRLETMHNTSSELVHPRPTTLRLATACVYVARMLVGNSSRRIGGMAAFLLSLTFSAWVGAAQATPPKVVRYHGYAVEVPRSWNVYDLAKDPRVCVRFDRHAVYLGAPTAQEQCPAHTVGRTEAILLAPASATIRRALARSTASAAAATVPRGPGAATFLARSRQVVVTATWSRDRGVVADALNRPSLRASAATATASPHPVVRARSRSSSPTAHPAAAVFGGLGFDACSAPSRTR